MAKLAMRTAFLVLLAVAPGCRKTATAPAADLVSIVPPSVMQVPPQDMRKALAASYRLKPDRRFLLAIGDIHQFLSGQPAQQADAEFKETGWEIRYRGDIVGDVPELPDSRCEASYYLGLRAQSEGRLRDASDWYRISIESGLQNMGEYRWAYNQLYLWEGEGKSLERIAAEQRAARN